MTVDAALMARLELSLHLRNLTQAEKTLLARDLLQFATPEEALRVANELLLRIHATVRLSSVRVVPWVVEESVINAAKETVSAVQYLDESKAREAGGT